MCIKATLTKAYFLKPCEGLARVKSLKMTAGSVSASFLMSVLSVAGVLLFHITVVLLHSPQIYSRCSPPFLSASHILQSKTLLQLFLKLFNSILVSLFLPSLPLPACCRSFLLSLSVTLLWPGFPFSLRQPLTETKDGVFFPPVFFPPSLYCAKPSPIYKYVLASA